jgi:hypothetical protein
METAFTCLTRIDRISRAVMKSPVDKKHQCSECEKSFCRLIFLTRHMRSHNGDKPFACLECPKTFSLQGNLTRHNLTRHQIIHTCLEKTVYRCLIHDITFRCWSAYNEHRIRHHTEPDSEEYIDFHDAINEKNRIRYHTDDAFRLNHLRRSRQHYFFKGAGGNRSARTDVLHGGTPDQGVAHLNDNKLGLVFGAPGVEVDHIRPLDSFISTHDCFIEQRKAFHYLNTQLLSQHDNRQKWYHFDPVAYAATEAAQKLAVLAIEWERTVFCPCAVCMERVRRNALSSLV